MSKILENSIWPNEDGNLGNIKVQIPDGVNVKWPEGDTLLNNCVYQNAKLTGFVDTKALIENDSKTTVFPYDYVDITLDKRLESTMTFNAGERCKHLNINYEVMLPEGYKKLEYLESTGTQYINTKWYPLKIQYEFFDKGYRVDGCLMSTDAWQWIVGLSYSNASMGLIGPCRRSNSTCVQFLSQRIYPNNNPNSINSRFVCELNYRNSRVSRLQCVDGVFENALNNVTQSKTMSSSFLLFAITDQASTAYKVSARIWSVELTNGNDIVAYYIPALDPTGAPCMYDIISQETFYNDGTGDFLYPGAESQVVTSDLDENFYAKMTEHGIRKLYHVPEDFTGSKDEYAIENGFKQLVEPPMPVDGYWASEWTETDTLLICNWVEVDAPAEI